jgi:hypothetical protein
MSACDTRGKKTGRTHHPSTVNMMSMMLATHGVPHYTPGTVTCKSAFQHRFKPVLEGSSPANLQPALLPVQLVWGTSALGSVSSGTQFRGVTVKIFYCLAGNENQLEAVRHDIACIRCRLYASAAEATMCAWFVTIPAAHCSPVECHACGA